MAQSCWHVYVVDLVEFETGPNIYGGTSRLSSQLSIPAKILSSSPLKYKIGPTIFKANV